MVDPIEVLFWDKITEVSRTRYFFNFSILHTWFYRNDFTALYKVNSLLWCKLSALYKVDSLLWSKLGALYKVDSFLWSKLGALYKVDFLIRSKLSALHK